MIQSNVIWTSKDAVKATGGVSKGEWQVTGVSIDTRTLEQGDLFVALTGDNGDGHRFVKDAIGKGAVAALVSQKIEGVDDEKLLIVEDTLAGLEALGRAARERTKAKIIAITGSVGKTSTKELLATALTVNGQTHASVKSYNNHWGVPLSLARMHAGTDYAVFEVGMNHANEITPLTKMIRPNIAIITTIAPVHIENFDDGIDGVVKAKAEIFDGLQSDGIAILEKDNMHFDALSNAAKDKNLKIYSFGEDDQANAQLENCLEAANGSRTKANILDEELEFGLQIAGRHMARNSLAVLLAVKLLDADVKKSIRAIASMQPVQGRGRRELLDIGQKDNPVTLIDESYNASPTAMQAAFKVMALIDPGRGGRRIAVLGDMLELGKDSDALHGDLALPLQAAGVDLVYTCGNKMKNLYDKIPQDRQGAHMENSRQLAEIVPDVLIPGDVVMVKGSLGSKMGLVVEALRSLPIKLKKITKV